MINSVTVSHEQKDSNRFMKNEPEQELNPERKRHKAAELFPTMGDDEYESFKRDIKENGLIEPICLHPEDGSIIDGRNRYRACMELGIEPRFRTWDGSSSLTAFVISANLHRRHLTSNQRAAMAVRLLPELKKEAKTRQGARNDIVELIPQYEQGKARDHATEIVNTNPRYVSDAEKLAEEAPDLFMAVADGEKTLPKAKREHRKRKRGKKLIAPPLPDGKYRVLHADPPWEYNDSCLDDYGHAERHYNTLSVQELVDPGPEITELSESDAVLFLWTTAPLLEDSFKIIKAWGFKYKTSFVWDKIKHNYGHYNSVRHEHLLIATRGSCTPDVKKLFDSVQSIERSDVHSEKPEEFREIIDTIYPYGKRIELFARKKNLDGIHGGMKMLGNTTLVKNGIHTETSDLRVHVSMAMRSVYVFPTQTGIDAIDPTRHRKVPVHQNGIKTAIGWLVRPEDMKGCRTIDIPSSVLRFRDNRRSRVSLSRQFIGFDKNQAAVQISNDRLRIIAHDKCSSEQPVSSLLKSSIAEGERS